MSEQSETNGSPSTFLGVCSLQEASQLALDQLGASACGQTAVVTAAIISGVISRDDLQTVDYSMCTLRTRAETAPLPQYLLSRSDAGCTGEEVAASFNAFVAGLPPRGTLPTAEFVPFSSIDGPLSSFLRRNFEQKNILVATMNLQLIGNDAWHHQLMYGVDLQAGTVYTMNPLESCHITWIERFVSTPSVLLIRRSDVLSRVDRVGGDDSVFSLPDWRCFNVREQIDAMRADESIEFVVIPAAYVGGFTVIRQSGSPLAMTDCGDSC